MVGGEAFPSAPAFIGNNAVDVIKATVKAMVFIGQILLSYLLFVLIL
jgi:hypothetical protein